MDIGHRLEALVRDQARAIDAQFVWEIREGVCYASLVLPETKVDAQVEANAGHEELMLAARSLVKQARGIVSRAAFPGG
jgi:hypothetical protein